MTKLATRIVKGIHAEDLSEHEVLREFRALLAAGARIRCAGEAKADPLGDLVRRYPPRHKLRLFDTVFFLSHLRQDVNARFFVTYVLLDADRDVASSRRELFARLFYKDASLIWRSASHFARSESENWIGKGDLKWVVEHGERARYTAEETTNLPFEIQAPLDALTRAVPAPKRDERAMARVLRRAPDRRVAPYPDFIAPRRRAAADRRNLIHGGKRVAWFARAHDPASLRFARGFEPDFAAGMIEMYALGSRLYGGEIRKFRVLSVNRKIQYQFVAAPRQVWVVPPQALTTELSSFGVRTIDVNADDDLFVPGYEYHFLDDSEDPPQIYSQIPPGFAGLDQRSRPGARGRGAVARANSGAAGVPQGDRPSADRGERRMLTGLKLLVGLIGFWLGIFGVRWMFAPASIATEWGVSLGNAVAFNVARGDLGGLLIAGASLCALGLVRNEGRWLQAVALMLGCVAVGRVVGIVADGFTSASLVAIVVEILMLAVLLLTAARMKNV